MKHISKKCKLPEPWYYGGRPPKESLEGLTAYKPKRVVTTMKQKESILLDAGFTPKQIAALKDAGAIKP